MAVYISPYNPWRERLAVSFLSPIIYGAVNRWVTSGQNRKKNALLSQLAGGGTMGPGGTGGKGIPPGMSGVPGSPGSPGGGLTGGSMAGGGGVSGLFRNLGTDRFGMLDPGEMTQLSAPLFAEQQAQAAAAMRRQNLDQLMGAFQGAQTPEQKMDALLGGVAAGTLPHEAFRTYGNWQQHSTPHLKEHVMDFGDRRELVNFNPSTGEAGVSYSGDVKMSPYQEAEIDVRNRNAATGEFNAATSRMNYDLSEEKYRNPNVPGTLDTREDGTRVLVNRSTGETKTLDYKNPPKESGVQRMSDVDKAKLTRINKERGILQSNLYGNAGVFLDDASKQTMKDRITALNAEEETIFKNYDSSLGEPDNPIQNVGSRGPELEEIKNAAAGEQAVPEKQPDPLDNISAWFWNGKTPRYQGMFPVPPVSGDSPVPRPESAGEKAKPKGQNRPGPTIDLLTYHRLIKQYGQPEVNRMLREANAKVVGLAPSPAS